jgi:GNAT superfamily N-acetyltransferase
MLAAGLDPRVSADGERADLALRTVGAVPASGDDALDRFVTELGARVPAPLGLVPGPWPVPTGRDGVGDDALRELLADDWAGGRTSAAKLRKLIDSQLVSRHRELETDHPNACDLGITQDGATIGRLLLDGVEPVEPGSPAGIQLVDIAIRPDRQRQGTGGQLIRLLLATADDLGRPVRATGVYGTAALTWLLRIGLVDTGGDALYRELVWPGR